MKLKGKQKKKTAIVFVDFEYMQISHKNRYGIEPPILSWYRALCDEYDVRSLYVFADFSNPAMKNNLPILRQITGNIIETQNTSSHYKKDFTDFFMLDKIYQKAFDKHSAQTYILFTGDGHFGAVCRFLKSHCDKEVVIYGIEGNISGQLYNQVSRVVVYPDEETVKSLYIPSLARLYDKLQRQGKQKRSLDLSAVAGAANRAMKFDKSIARTALDDMVEKEYLTYSEEWVSSLKRTRILVCDKEKMKNDGFDV